MFSRGVFVILCVFVGRLDCQSEEAFFDLDVQCFAICTQTGGVAEFDIDNKMCICTVDLTVDEMQKAQMVVDAVKAGVQMEIREGFPRPFVKREVGGQPQPEDHFVGQWAPNRLVTPRRMSSTTRRTTPRRTTSRAVTPNRGRTPPGQNMNVHQRWEQLQKQLNDRRRSRARNSGGPHLQLRAAFESNSRPNLMERLRERQKEMHERRKTKIPTPTTADPNVGASAPKPDVNPVVPPILQASHDVGKATSEKINPENHHLEIITQDPSLYQGDNKL